MSFTAKMRSPYLKERKTKFQLLAKILHPLLLTVVLGMGGDGGIFALTRAVPIQMRFAFYLT